MKFKTALIPLLSYFLTNFAIASPPSSPVVGLWEAKTEGFKGFTLQFKDDGSMVEPDGKQHSWREAGNFILTSYEDSNKPALACFNKGKLVVTFPTKTCSWICLT